MDFVATPIVFQDNRGCETPPQSYQSSLTDVFKDAGNKWKEAHISELVNNLDRISLETLEQQQHRQTRRKHLAALTKDFIDSEAQTQHDRIGPLIKSYQSEIDDLCQRCKNLENCLLSNLTPWRGIPNMDVICTTAIKALESAEINNKRLEKYEKEMNEILQRREQEILKPLQERIDNLKIQNRDLEAQWKKEIESSAMLKSSHLQQIESLLKENQEKSTELLSKNRELQKKSSEFEIKETQWQQLEKQLDQLHTDSEKGTVQDPETIQILEAELQNLRSLVESLQIERNSLQTNLNLNQVKLEQESKYKTEKEEALEARIQHYSSLLEIKDKDIESLREEIVKNTKLHEQKLTSQQEHITRLEGLLHGFDTPTLDKGDPALAKIFVVQRDRLKWKCDDLEKALASKSQALAKLKNENDLLQKENIAMFEKIEYLSGFPAHPLCAPPSKDSACNLNLRTVSSSGCDKIERKYKELYEDKLHTFHEFSRREIHRKWRQLGFIDQMSLRLSSMLMKKASSRKMFFAYIILIHLFAIVFFFYICLK